MIFFICTKFHETTFDSLKNSKWTPFSNGKLQTLRCLILLKMYIRLWFLFPAPRLIMFYICTKFWENISKCFRVIKRTQKVQREVILQTKIGSVMAFVFCTSSDNTLYFYEV